MPEIGDRRVWYDQRMRDAAVLLFHAFVTICRILRPGGLRSVVAESVLLKHQLGHYFTARIEGMGIEQVRIAAQSPWQNCYVERVVGSIRRECLNHVVVVSDRHLRRILKSYFRYYHRSRTHLSLGKDAPESREVQRRELGRIVPIPEVGGLHHRYERRAA